MNVSSEIKKVLITVRTYPTPARQGVEVSCTAGITQEGEWIRIFPVSWRLLDNKKKFGKYQWIQVEVTKSSDPRPESYKIKNENITILTDRLPCDCAWKERSDIVYKLRSESLCALKEKRDLDGAPTLGFFRPKSIEKLIITPESPNWTDAQLAALRQGNLFAQAPKEELQKIPYKFQYQFTCDNCNCNGHTLMCSDWEMGQAWRQWEKTYGDKWEEKFREKYEDDMINKNDTQFYVGTLHGHPGTWIIIGLYYPPFVDASDQLPLF
jgi:hypothetical protein